MAGNVDKMYEATLAMLKQELASVYYPMPVSDEADLATIVARAFLRGAAFVAEACNLDGKRYILKGEAIMHEHAKQRGGTAGTLILPGDKAWTH